MNTLDLAQKKVMLRKVSGTYGGEWQGPCPACGGENRFHVWPNQNEGRGSYWCRSCEKAGDNIQFLRDFDGMGFKEACDELGIDLPDRPAQDARPSTTGPKPPQQQAPPPFEPQESIPPADLWQEKAGKLIEWAHENLMKNVEVREWLAARGIDAKAASAARLGWNWGEPVTITDAQSPRSKDIYRARKSWGLPEVLKDDGRPKALWIPVGLVIPYIIDGIVYRIRIRRPEGEPRYYVLPGSSMATMIIGRDRRAYVIVESELDAIAVVANNTLAGAVALGSVSAKPDADAHAVLRGALQILNALDYGDEGGGAKAAEGAMTWWAEHFDRCDRWPTPQGKDVGEAYELGIDLEKWIRKGLPPALTIGMPQTAREAAPGGAIGRGADRSDRPVPDMPPALRELYDLLRKNPAVRIINSPGRFTVLRDGKYVGGRISELVFRTPGVTDYLLSHPAEEIDGGNFITGGRKGENHDNYR
ncbi:MAG TPA: alpha helicase [Syntrophaceae bacterium]|nr:alpha helicase [Syntrophaceae bacterium]